MSSRAKRYKRNLKARLFIAQGGLCWLCGKRMEMGTGGHDPMFATLDHVRPKKFGGTNAQDNLMLAHGICNSTRGHKEELRTMTPP